MISRCSAHDDARHFPQRNLRDIYFFCKKCSFLRVFDIWVDTSMFIIKLRMKRNKAMKTEMLAKRMMVLFISAAMLVAGPGAGVFAFAEDDESGTDNAATVQTE